MQAMLLPAAVTPGRHLSAFLISLPLNASPEGSLVFRSAGGFSGPQPPIAQRLAVASTGGGGLVKKGDVGGPQLIFLPSGPLLAVFSSVRVLPVSLGHPLEKC